MEQKLIRFLKRHQIIFERKKVMVAVSGGPDSVALLHLFNRWRNKWNFTLYAITFDHQLRAEAKEDVEYVETLCKAWDIPLIAKRLHVREFKIKHKVSTQVAARELRYKAFHDVIEQYAIDYLALGHHGDDQIETIIMRLLRSTNLSSFVGIPYKRAFSTGEIIRPLLAVSKAEIEAYCERNNLHYRIDPSNEDTLYTRNYVRQLIVPKLKEKNENLHVTIQRLAESLQEDEDYLRKEAERFFQKIVLLSSHNRSATIEVTHMLSRPVSLQRRIFRLTLDYLYDSKMPQLSYSHEQIFLSLLKPNIENKVLHFPNNLVIETSYGKIHFYFNKEDEQPFLEVVEHIPATILLPDGNVMEVFYTNQSESKSDNELIFPTSQIDFPLYIRTRKPGDRMRYKGLSGSKKIKDILIDEKIPRAERDRIFVVSDSNDKILWLVGIRKGIVKEREQQDERYVMFQYINANEGER